VNLVSAEQNERFNIELAGCTSHARRSFAIHENEDPDNCAYMLHLFKGLYIYEKALDLQGRNDTNVRAIRGSSSRFMWEEIRELATSMTEKWSSATKIGIAARAPLQDYVIHVLRASPEDVMARAEDYTAVAYARKHAKSNEDDPVPTP